MRTITNPASLRLSAVFLASALVFGCGTQAKRDSYTGADTAAELQPDFLVGKWRATVLNPVASEGRNQALYVYSNDGTWKGNIEATTSDGTPVGNFEATGTWQINGQYVMSTVGDIRETSGSKLAGFMLGTMRSSWQKQINRVNPYEVTKDRIIWVEETKGQAMQLDRVSN